LRSSNFAADDARNVQRIDAGSNFRNEFVNSERDSREIRQRLRLR
jgi:hypothetical protein